MSKVRLPFKSFKNREKLLKAKMLHKKAITLNVAPSLFHVLNKLASLTAIGSARIVSPPTRSAKVRRYACSCMALGDLGHPLGPGSPQRVRFSRPSIVAFWRKSNVQPLGKCELVQTSAGVLPSSGAPFTAVSTQVAMTSGSIKGAPQLKEPLN